MKSISVNLRVQNVRTFSNAEGRQYINLITVERFPKRKADEETGEYIETTTNELVMSLKQFMHVVYLTPNFLQVYFKDFDRKAYTITPDGVWYSLLLGASISVTIERYEDGDTFTNEIDGEEMTSDGVTFHTHINDIELSDFGNDFGFGEPEDMAKMIAILKSAKQARGTKFDFATDKANTATAE